MIQPALSRGDLPCRKSLTGARVIAKLEDGVGVVIIAWALPPPLSQESAAISLMVWRQYSMLELKVIRLVAFLEK